MIVFIPLDVFEERLQQYDAHEEFAVGSQRRILLGFSLSNGLTADIERLGHLRLTQFHSFSQKAHLRAGQMSWLHEQHQCNDLEELLLPCDMDKRVTTRRALDLRDPTLQNNTVEACLFVAIGVRM